MASTGSIFLLKCPFLRSVPTEESISSELMLTGYWGPSISGILFFGCIVSWVSDAAVAERQQNSANRKMFGGPLSPLCKPVFISCLNVFGSRCSFTGDNSIDGAYQANARVPSSFSKVREPLGFVKAGREARQVKPEVVNRARWHGKCGMKA